MYSDDMAPKPYWWEEAPPSSLPAATLPKAMDVLVVGAGYAGLSAGLALARAGRSVAICEADELGVGASTRNGGGFGGSIKVSFTRLAAKIGVERAKAYYREGWRAVEHVIDFIAREGIECQLALTGRFTGAHAPSHYEAMARELELLSKHLDIEMDMIPKAEQHREIGTDHYNGGRIIHRSGTIQPALWHRGLLDRVLESGERHSQGTKRFCHHRRQFDGSCAERHCRHQRLHRGTHPVAAAANHSHPEPNHRDGIDCARRHGETDPQTPHVR